MASFSKNENKSRSTFYGGEDNNKTIDNIKGISNNGNVYHYNESKEIAKTELNNIEEYKFLENVMKFCDYYYSRLTILLNLKKNDMKFPDLDINDLDSQITFLKEINRMFIDNNISGTISEYDTNKALKGKLREVILYNKKEKFDEKIENEFIEIIDGGFNLEKYIKNNKDNPKDKGLFSELSKNRNILAKFERKINKLIPIKNYFIKTQYDKKFFDSRGDLLIPNSNNKLKRGSEDYHPPYDWIGIGLDVSGKYKENEDDENGKWLFNYENSKWANAYLGFNQEMNSNDKNIINSSNIKEFLRNLIKNDDKLKIFERKVDFDDKRHWRKKYEKGIYLSSKIENVEKEACLVTIDNKQYKVLLMAKVKIDEISQPRNEDIWVLDKKFIRVYRILFKEKIN